MHVPVFLTITVMILRTLRASTELLVPALAPDDAAERGPLPDGRQRRGDAALELFHLFGREDDARLLVWSFCELRSWLELQRGCVCCAEEEALGS